MKKSSTKKSPEAVLSRRQRSRKELWAQRILFLLLLPAVVQTLLFCYKPMYGVVIAFQNYDILKGIWGSPFIGFGNFQKFLFRSDFMDALRNTVGISTLGLLVGFPLPILFAILVNDFEHRRFGKFVQSVTYLPHFLSWVIVAGLVYRMLDEHTGIVNQMIAACGADRIPFMRDPSKFWGVFTVSGLWKEMGWNSILYLSAMAGISPELYEAAKVDGANRLQCTWHVTLPGIMPTVVIMLIMSLSGFFSTSFDALYPMRNAMVATASDTIDIYSYFRGIQMGEYGYATAIGLFQSVLAIVILFSANKALKKSTGYSIF